MAGVTVTVDDTHLDKIEEVAAHLRKSGMHVDQVLNEIGVISGSVPDDRRQLLQTVTGVQSVEDTATVQLPPPESPVQ
jgi:uncharacterized membrane-anchored protein